MRTRRSGRWLLKQPRLGARMCQWHILFYIGHILLILLHLYKRRNRPVNLGGESDGQPDASSGIHDSPPGKGRTWGRHHQAIPEVAVIGTPFFNDLPEGIKRAVAAVVAGLITLLFFTLNPSVKALAMGSQGAQGTDFMVPSYLAVSYIRDFLEEMKHMEL